MKLQEWVLEILKEHRNTQAQERGTQDTATESADLIFTNTSGNPLNEGWPQCGEDRKDGSVAASLVPGWSGSCEEGSTPILTFSLICRTQRRRRWRRCC